MKSIFSFSINKDNSIKSTTYTFVKFWHSLHYPTYVYTRVGIPIRKKKQPTFLPSFKANQPIKQILLNDFIGTQDKIKIQYFDIL